MQKSFESLRGYHPNQEINHLSISNMLKLERDLRKLRSINDQFLSIKEFDDKKMIISNLIRLLDKENKLEEIAFDFITTPQGNYRKSKNSDAIMLFLLENRPQKMIKKPDLIQSSNRDVSILKYKLSYIDKRKDYSVNDWDQDKARRDEFQYNFDYLLLLRSGSLSFYNCRGVLE